jgi:hypothetical protein
MAFDKRNIHSVAMFGNRREFRQDIRELRHDRRDLRFDRRHFRYNKFHKPY